MSILGSQGGHTIESSKNNAGERTYKLCGARHNLYVRSPAAFLEDSMLWPSLLPRMLTNPRTVCFCHPVASIISVSVAPLARLIGLRICSAVSLLSGLRRLCGIATRNNQIRRFALF